MRGQAVKQSGRSIRRWGWARAALAVCASALLFSACGDDSSTPTSPSSPPATTTPAPTTPPSTSTTFTVSGTVTDTNTQDPIVGATVIVLDGAHEGQLSTTNDLGAFAIMELEGNLNVAVRAEGYLERRFSVHGVATTLDVDLAPGPSAPEPGPAPEPDDDAPEPEPEPDDGESDGDAAPAPVTPVNTPAMGMPTITGMAQVGETLTADTSAIMDADGLGPFTYQWMSDGAAISGAMAATYMVTAGDAGKTIMVKVTFMDGGGFMEELTSDPTVTVVSTPGNTLATGKPTITGTAQVGEVLMVNTDDIADENGLPETATFTYQWLADGMAIMVAGTDVTYTVTAGDDGKAITVRVTFTDQAGYPEVLTSEPAPRTVSPNTPAIGMPTIDSEGFTGAGASPRVGDELTALTDDIEDDNSPNGIPTFTYEWRTNPTRSNSLVSRMPKYRVQPLDAGKFIVVAVSFTDGGGYAEGPLMSDPTPAVLARVNIKAVFTPMIDPTGGRMVDAELTAVPGDIVDADNVPDFMPVFTYQWMTGTGDAAVRIPGATREKYTIKAGEVGKVNDAISVVVGFTDSRGNMEMATSDDTTAVTYANTLPVDTGLPTITGMAQVGKTLTADTSAIMDADGLGPFTYEWMIGQMAILGETGKTYTVKVGDADEPDEGIVVRVSFTDLGGTDEELTSAPPVEYENTLATGKPTITGTAQVGEDLMVNTDDIADADGLGPFTYQWLAAGIPVGGGDGTGATYEVLEADVDKSISVAVTFTDRRKAMETVTSAFTSVVLAAPRPNRAATGMPMIIVSDTDVMVGSVLTAIPGTIADENGLPETATFTYQWLADDVAIAGAMEATYTVSVADGGKFITVTVTFTDDDGYEEKRESDPTTVVGNPNFRP